MASYEYSSSTSALPSHPLEHKWIHEATQFLVNSTALAENTRMTSLPLISLSIPSHVADLLMVTIHMNPISPKCYETGKTLTKDGRLSVVKGSEWKIKYVNI